MCNMDNILYNSRKRYIDNYWMAWFHKVTKDQTSDIFTHIHPRVKSGGFFSMHGTRHVLCENKIVLTQK
jgi:hypothetical protein